MKTRQCAAWAAPKARNRLAALGALLIFTGGGGCHDRLRLEQVNPSSGPDNGLAYLELLGDGFYGTPTVAIDGVPAAYVARPQGLLGPDLRHLVVQLPARLGAVGAASIRVSLSDGQSVTRRDLFSYYRGTVQLQPSTLPIGSSSPAFATADLNGDGKTDLVIAEREAGVEVWLGQNDGSFTAAGNVRTDPGPVALAVADFDEDSRLDLAVACAGSHRVQLQFGKGDGHFDPGSSPGSSIDPGVDPSAVLAADLGGDGHVDLLAVDYAHSKASAIIGQGMRTFEAARPIPPFASQATLTGVAVVDWNADGRQDLIFAESLGSGLNVLIGHGDGTFEPVQPMLKDRLIGVTSPPVVADLNKDARPDLLVAGTDDRLYVLLGNRAGGFTAAPDVVFPGSTLFFANRQLRRLAVADLDGDGTPDVAVSNQRRDTNQTQGRGLVSVLVGRGDGRFAVPQDFAVDAEPQDIQVNTLSGGRDPVLFVSDAQGRGITLLRNALRKP